MKTLFLTLRTFSATGGIEKVCRVMGKALYEDSVENSGQLTICSMYDRQQDAFDNPYFPFEIFRGFAVSKVQFIEEMLRIGRKMDLVILSHINLLVVGATIRKLSPKTRIVLLAHGIEIWFPVSWQKKWMLRHGCDAIWAVSNFTRHKVIEVHGASSEKCFVLNNCLDPYLPLPTITHKSERLLQHYGIAPHEKIIMSLTRISSRERYKGYDRVVRALALLKEKHPDVRYLVAGKFDEPEKNSLETLAAKLGLGSQVLMPGYIEDDELEDHFSISDAYVMPSRKEGFGIVFIEAMYYGLPVVAGNIDGTVDALLQGSLGQLINPDDIPALAIAIDRVLQHREQYLPDRTLLLENFSYETYKRKLRGLLDLIEPVMNGPELIPHMKSAPSA